ncbi:MAG: 6,7-dimethyl-8-ribityllumazine synthase [Flavobacteriales bacterium]|nr:6,7-dimethyl-8-ribityllumazine synthase [Flavobacteriales bacterium]
MATSAHHLSDHDPSSVPDGAGFRLALLVSEWNREVTQALCTGALETLRKYGVREEDLFLQWVPGSFELALAAKQLVSTKGLDGALCLGSIVRGETPHFDYVCQATALGIMNAGLDLGRPIIFGVLTDDTMEQARDRSGGKHGNKGIDCAVALLKMVKLQAEIRG